MGNLAAAVLLFPTENFKFKNTINLFLFCYSAKISHRLILHAKLVAEMKSAGGYILLLDMSKHIADVVPHMHFL